jgi:predicted nucleotidyltransferase
MDRYSIDDMHTTQEIAAMQREQALETIRNHRAELLDFGVSSLAVFGSVARDTAGPASDVDILVEFKAPVGLFTFVRLQQHLEALLGSRVDLVTPEAIRPMMRDSILAEAARAI